MSNIIIERIQIRCSLAELAAMYLNDEISTEEYFEAFKDSPKPRENK